MRVVPATKTTAANIARLLLNNWEILWGFPEYIQTTDTVYFKVFLVALCLISSWTPEQDVVVPTEERASEENQKADSARMRNYVPEHQRDWGMCTQQLTYAYSVRECTASTLSSFSLVFRQPVDTALAYAIALATDITETKYMWAQKERQLHGVVTMCQDADKKMKSAGQRYEDSHDRKPRDAQLPFPAGHYIYLNQLPMIISRANKLTMESQNQLRSLRQDPSR